MTWSTGSPSTKRTDAPGARPGTAGAAPGRASARAVLRRLLRRGRTEVPPHLRLPRRTWLLAPACGVLVALCAVLAGWHAHGRPGPAGFDLRAAPASSNVDTNSASADGAPPPSPPRQPLDKASGGQEESARPPASNGPEQPPEPPVLELPPLPPAPPLTPSEPSPASDASGIVLPPVTLAPLLPPAERYESHRDLQRGDSTMPHLKTLGLPIALAAALSGQPLATAADVEKPPTLEQTAKDVKDLKEAHEKSSKALMEQLKIIQDQLKPVEGLRKDVDALKGTIQSLHRELELSAQMHSRTGGDLREVQAQVKQLREELDRAKAQAGKLEQELTNQAARCDGLNRELAALRKQAADGTRQAARLTEGTGTIRLYNTFGLPVSVVVNGRSYRLDPGETYVLGSQPVGPFDYEVLGLGYEHRRTETLTAGKPFEIEVFDRGRGPIKTPPKLPR